jgi:hypothetical protein
VTLLLPKLDMGDEAASRRLEAITERRGTLMKKMGVCHYRHHHSHAR